MRVVVAEDLFLLRDGLVRLVEAHGHTVAAAVGTGQAALDALLATRPDVAIVDVRLPPTFSDEGLQAALAARRQIPALPVLILSAHVEQLYARELLADGRGGVGYQLKDRVMDAAQFMDALERVAAGGTALDPEVVAKLLGRAEGTGGARADPLAALTERERSVLALMAEGLSNTAIAARLFLSEGAISKYTTTTFAKLGLANDDDTNRRVRAVLAYLGADAQPGPPPGSNTTHLTALPPRLSGCGRPKRPGREHASSGVPDVRRCASSTPDYGPSPTGSPNPAPPPSAPASPPPDFSSASAAEMLRAEERPSLADDELPRSLAVMVGGSCY